jgi:adenosylcobinamide-GDP ribazoletransferase
VTAVRDAIGLLTTFGRRGGELRARAFAWFPIVGAALGAIVGGCWWAADQLWTGLVPAVIVVAADLAVTGMLHVDGLADSADGLLPHANREQRLAIMRTPDIGAFGATVVAVVLLAEVGALVSQPVSVFLVVGLWAAARALVASVPAYLSYARDEGIVSALLDGAPRWPVFTVPLAVAVAAAGSGVRGAVAVAAGVLAGVGVLVLARRRLGGFTGDVLGATIAVAETVGLVVAAGRW